VKKKEPSIKILAREKTRYNDIYVIQNGEHRELWFKGNGEYYLQSRTDTQGQNPLALVYSRMIMASLLFCPQPKRMLMVGLGGAVVSNCLGKWLPNLKIDIVEIDEKVIDLSKKYFSLRESSHCRVFAEDGRVFIQKQQESYDWIILDAFKSGSIPYHLKTCEFYKEIRAALNLGGVVGSNLYGKGNTLKPRDTKTFLSVFPQIYCFEDDDQVATVLIATDGERWDEEKIRDKASVALQSLPQPFSMMQEVAKTYRLGKFLVDSASMFEDHFSDNGFLHDVENENRQSSKGRRYPITNVQ
jgi:spermidine synthase